MVVSEPDNGIIRFPFAHTTHAAKISIALAIPEHKELLLSR
jgi:hypothetical protein